MKLTDCQLAKFNDMVKNFAQQNHLSATIETNPLNMSRTDVRLVSDNKWKRYVVLWEEVPSLTDAGTRIFADASIEFGLVKNFACSTQFDIQRVMTCREKLKLEHPDRLDEIYSAGCCGCPSMLGYLEDPKVCGTRVMSDDDCRKCWDREIPETDISNNEKENETMSVTVPVNKMTKAQMLEEIERAHAHIVEVETELKNLEKYKQYEAMANEMKAMHTAFMNSGFSDEQAFDMIKMLTQAVVPAALRGMSL